MKSDKQFFNLINTLLLTKLMEMIKKPEEPKEIEEKQTPKEQLVEMYANPKDDGSSAGKTNINKIMEEYGKRPLDQNMILQKMEALTKEKEIISQQKQDIVKDRILLNDQTKSMQRATLEVNKNG